MPRGSVFEPAQPRRRASVFEPAATVAPRADPLLHASMGGADAVRQRADEAARQTYGKDSAGFDEVAAARELYQRAGGRVEEWDRMAREEPPEQFRQRATEFYRNLSRVRESEYRSREGEAAFRRFFGAPLKGMTAGLVDTASMGAGLEDGLPGLDVVAESRARAGRGSRFVEGALEMGGAAIPIAAASRVVGAVPAMAGYGAVSGAASAPEGQRVEGAVKGGVQMGVMGAVAAPLTRLFGGGPAAGVVRNAVAEGGSNVLGGMVGQAAVGERPEARPEDAVLGVATYLLRLPAARRAEALAQARSRAATPEDVRALQAVEAEVAKATPPATAQEASAAIQDAVRTGQTTLREVVSPGRAEAVEGAQSVQEARQILDAKPAEVTPEGRIEGGYDPQAAEKGLVEPAAVPLVEQAKAEGLQPVSSGGASPETGKPYVIARDPETGAGVRVEGAEPAPAAPAVEAPAPAPASEAPARPPVTEPVKPARQRKPKAGPARPEDVPEADWNDGAALYAHADRVRHAGIRAVRDGDTPKAKTLRQQFDAIRARQDELGRMPQRQAAQEQVPPAEAAPVSAEIQALRDAYTKAADRLASLEAGEPAVPKDSPQYRAWSRKRSAAKKAEVEASNNAYRADPDWVMADAQRRRDLRPAPRASYNLLDGRAGRNSGIEERGSMAFLAKPAQVLQSGMTSLIDRVKRGGSDGKGGTVAERAAEKLRADADAQRRIRGAMSAEEEAARLSRGGLIGKRASARRRLEEPEVAPGGGYYRSPMQEISEERRVTTDPEMQQIVDAERDLLTKRWDLAREAGVMRENPQTGVMEPLGDAPPSRPRMPTEVFRDILADPKHPYYDQMIDAFAREEGIPKAEAKARLEQDARSVSEADQRARPEAFEFFRGWKRVPHALEVNGKPLFLFENSLDAYARRIVEGGAARIAFTETFGQDFYVDDQTGKRMNTPGPVERLEDAYTAETGRRDVIAEGLRAASGRPLRGRMDLGHRERQVVDFAQAALRVGKTLKLSSTWLYNALEPLAQGREQAGALDTVQAYVEAVGAGLQRVTGGRLGSGLVERFTELRNMGAIGGGRPSTQGFVEGTIARAAQIRAGKMQRRTGPTLGSRRDAARLKQMGYAEADAERIASGGGTQAEYDAYVRRAAPQATGSRLAPQEMSTAELQRATKWLFPIVRYATRQLQQVARGGSEWVKAVGGLKRGDVKGAAAATAQLASTLGGRAVVGAGQALLYALAVGGPAGLAAAIARFKDDPEKALGQGLASNVTAGPYASFLRVAQGDADIASGIFPVALAKEFHDLATGSGPYKDMEWADKVERWTKGMIPVLKVAETAYVGTAAMFGAEDRETEWREAIKAYRAWQRDRKIKSIHAEVRNPTEADEQFTSNMRLAYRAMLADGNPDKIKAYIQRAVGAEGKDFDNFKASIQGRLLIKGADSKEYVEDVKRFVGERAFRALEAHDDLLLSLIQDRDAQKRLQPIVRPLQRQNPVPMERVDRALGAGK